MPSPKAEIAQLNKLLADNPPKTPEQKEVAKTLRNPKLLDAVDELDKQPGKRANAAANPAKYLRDQGVPIPDKMTVHVAPDNWGFSICFYVCGGWSSSRGWWLSW